jgi:hypothetical protein
LFFVVLLSLWIGSCENDPEFSEIPEIDFESVDFKEGGNLDTLIIRVRFQDGDGDLGLSGNELDPPYNPFIYEPSPDGDPCRFSERFDKPCSNVLPAEYSCTYYEYRPTFGQDDSFKDTLYRVINENSNNFIVELLTKENGQFEVYEDSNCTQTLSGRFPHLKVNFNGESPLEGVIEYKAPSTSYFSLFRNDTLKLRMRIKDRTLHDSNTVESCEFTLDELLETPNGECPPRP